MTWNTPSLASGMILWFRHFVNYFAPDATITLFPFFALSARWRSMEPDRYKTPQSLDGAKLTCENNSR
jgi:hypothetical protein